MCRGVARIGTNRLIQNLRRLALLSLSGIKHSQIVIGLWQLRVVARQCSEQLDGLGVLLLFCRNHTLQKAHLQMVWILLEVTVCLLCSLTHLALLNQPRHLIDLFLCMRWHSQQGHSGGQCHSCRKVPQTRNTQRNSGLNHKTLSGDRSEKTGLFVNTQTHLCGVKTSVIL